MPHVCASWVECRRGRISLCGCRTVSQRRTGAENRVLISAHPPCPIGAPQNVETAAAAVHAPLARQSIFIASPATKPGPHTFFVCECKKHGGTESDGSHQPRRTGCDF